ncbi:MAG TPA: class I SAM-dependent methyltransferase [Kiritimatiellia bacterium]|nr:class I SAM-dependent methyltransferase [Kiritimatiellia bacterium]
MNQEQSYRKRLDVIANIHLNPDPAQRVDALCQLLDRDKLMPWVVGPKVLEMGCGDGVWTTALVEKFGHSAVVDGSQKLLAALKIRFGDKITCYDSLFEEFTPPSMVLYDTVIATHILEHVDDPVKVLKQMHYWLKPGGRVIIVVPNAESYHRQIGVIMRYLDSVYDLSERDHLVGHQRVYDLTMLRNHVMEAGYKIILERGFMIKTVSNAQMAEYSDDLIKAFVDLSDHLPARWMNNLGMVIERPSC